MVATCSAASVRTDTDRHDDDGDEGDGREGGRGDGSDGRRAGGHETAEQWTEAGGTGREDNLQRIERMFAQMMTRLDGLETLMNRHTLCTACGGARGARSGGGVTQKDNLAIYGAIYEV